MSNGKHHWKEHVLSSRATKQNVLDIYIRTRITYKWPNLKRASGNKPFWVAILTVELCRLWHQHRKYSFFKSAPYYRTTELNARTNHCLQVTRIFRSILRPIPILLQEHLIRAIFPAIFLQTIIFRLIYRYIFYAHTHACVYTHLYYLAREFKSVGLATKGPRCDENLTRIFMNPCYMNIININSKTSRTWMATQTKIRKKNAGTAPSCCSE